MSILSTNKKLIRVGAEYSAGSGISIDDGVISVTGEFGKTYSAGNNVDIYEQGEQLYISSKDWTNDIANASANAYNEAVAQIPDPFDPSYLSAQIDNKLNSSDFTTWQNGQYTTDLQTIEGQINNKLDTSSFSDVSGSFLTAHQSLDGYATEDWVTAQGYITGVDLSNYYTKDETSGKEELANAFDNIPVGDPEVNAYVTDNSASLNGTTDLVQNSSGLWNDVAVYQSNSANYLTAHQDISYKLDESAFADVSGTFLTAIPADMATTGDVAELAQTVSETYQVKGDYATVEDVESATSGKANTFDLRYYVPLSGITGGFAHARLDYYKLSLSSKLTADNTSSYGNFSTFGINNYVKSPDNVYQYAAECSLAQTGLYLYQSSAYGSAYSGWVELRPNYFNLKSVNGNAYISLNTYELLNIYTSANGSNSPSFIRFDKGNGLSYSAENSGIGQFFINASSNMDVPRYNPVWIVKNGTGDGFSIGAGEAKGFDKDGNTIWSTKMSKATQLINGGSDPKPAILLTPVPTVPAYSAQWSAAPHISADYQSLTISYGAGSPNVRIYPTAVNFSSTLTMSQYGAGTATGIVGVGTVNSASWQINNDFRINKAGITYSLTASVQKREIEYDADTSAITAINGSAIGGGGVTGEFVPQSAFDELKASYDALSSLFATYSGQWLLPNEGEE